MTTVPVRREGTPMGRLGLLAAAVVVLLAAVVAVGVLGQAGQVASPSSSPAASVASGTPTPSAAPSAPTRDTDGIPTTLNGQPVYRGAAARQFADQRTNDTPFYVAGWLSLGLGIPCPSDMLRLNPWLATCGEWVFDPGAYDAGSGWDSNITFVKVDSGLASLATGPTIVQVHVHDSRAAECGSFQADCAEMMVVSTVVWTGDDASAPLPISVAAAVNAVVSTGGASSLAPLTWATHPIACLMGTTWTQILVPPANPTTSPAVAALYVFRTPAMRQPFIHAPDGVDAMWNSPEGPLCRASQLPNATGEYRWFGLANVVVLLHVSAPATPADHAYTTKLAAALEGLAAPSAPSPAWLPLPTADVTAACGTDMPGATIQGDPNDPRLVWVQMADGTTHPALFPPGYHARFNPGLEIVDDVGRVMLSGGQLIGKACTWNGDELVLLHP